MTNQSCSIEIYLSEKSIVLSLDFFNVLSLQERYLQA